VALLYFFHTCQKNSVFYSKICGDENINNPTEETTPSAWQLCESYEYSVSHDTAAAYIESLSEIRQDHGLTNWAFIQLYVNGLADTLHVFNIECKHGGNITQLGLGNIQD